MAEIGTLAGEDTIDPAPKSHMAQDSFLPDFLTLSSPSSLRARAHPPPALPCFLISLHFLEQEEESGGLSENYFALALFSRRAK